MPWVQGPQDPGLETGTASRPDRREGGCPHGCPSGQAAGPAVDHSASVDRRSCLSEESARTATVGGAAPRTGRAGRPGPAAAGNRAMASVLSAASAGAGHSRPPTVVVSRLFLEPERPPVPSELGRYVAAYALLVRERWPVIKPLIESEADRALSDRFGDSFRAFEAARQVDDPGAWDLLVTTVATANELERRAIARGQVAQPTGPLALSAQRVAEIRELASTEFDRTRTLLGVLAAAGGLLSQVFGPAHQGAAQAGMGQIRDQLTTYERGGKVRIDATGALAAGGTVLQNTGRGALAAATMDITDAWARKEERKRRSALVHEASHGAATATEDKAYLDSWSLEGLSGPDRLKNAGHYELAAEVHLGLRQSPAKPLASSTSQHAAPIRAALAAADVRIKGARLRSGRVLKRLTEPAFGGAEDGALMVTVGGLLGLPFAPHGGRLAASRPTSIDVELFSVFRSWMEDLHRLVSRFSQVDLVADEGRIEIQGTRVTIDARMIRAGSDPAALVRRIALFVPERRSLPADACGAALDALAPA